KAFGSITIPLPSTLVFSLKKIPEGIRCNLYVMSSNTIVCPALFPPLYRATTSAFFERKSVIFHFLSSPHCVLTTSTELILFLQLFIILFVFFICYFIFFIV